MSYLTAVQRATELRARLNLGEAAGVITMPGRSFDTVLATANNRMANGPERLNLGIEGFEPSEWGDPTAEAAALRSGRGTKRFNGINDELRGMITTAATKHGVPRELVMSVARAESAFRSDVTSPAGAQGLMQLMPATARGLGVTDPMDPQQNLNGGAKYLRQMLDRYDGDARIALAAYNAGPGNVDKYGGIPPFEETRTYVARVLGYAKELGWTP